MNGSAGNNRGRRLIVIGGGIGGYTAAIRGARHGMDVTLVEEGDIGGTCLNVGCIPTKSLLHNTEMIRSLPHHLALAGHGGRVVPAPETIVLLGREKSAAVKRLVSGVETLIRRNRIDRIADRAVFAGSRTIRLASSGRELTGDIVVIATGSVPAIPDIDGIGGPGVITSDEAISLSSLPSRIAILGGGVIGVEFAQLFANLGVAVTIVELAETILGGEDPEAVDILKKSLTGQGVDIRTGTRVRKIETGRTGIGLKLEEKAGTVIIHTDQLLVATGRKPNVEGLGLENTGIEIRDGAIVVDDRQRTGVSGVYAVGDVTGGSLLAHRAAAQAECAMADVLGLSAPPMSAIAMPRAVYTMPEIASVGMSEAEARSLGPVKVGRFPFSANGKALVGGHAEGFVKVVADAGHEQILGVTMVGAGVSNLLGEATLAVQMELTLEALMHTVHAHPTLSEALVEAAHDARDAGAIHLPPARERASAVA